MEDRKDLVVVNPEITSLNINNLDVEELERRLELAALMPAEAPWICGAYVDCPNLDCGVDGPAEEIAR